MRFLENFVAERMKVRYLIEGIMPERALLRLKRAKIAVYDVKKRQKNQILLSVKKKDCEKVFAIFPDPCYNSGVYSAYTAKRLGVFGGWRYLEKIKNRTGLVIGALLFCALTLFADGFVFGVRFAGTEIYAREAVMALEENGIKPFVRYQKGSEDLVCAKLLKNKGVEFCSVQKKGLYVVVEMRLSPFLESSPKKGDMCSQRSGKVLSIVALRGTPQKKAGDSVKAGETLVGGYFQTQSGEKKCVEVIARASIACTYESRFQGVSEEEAFAKAYLELALSEKDTITKKSIEKKGNECVVAIEYTAIQTINF